MKLLSDSPGASMSMSASERLRLLLIEVLTNEKISHVLETGTFQGLGSTKFVSEAFALRSPPQLFVTIETNWVSWRTAKHNLLKFPFVSPIWGTSVSLKRAQGFLQTDGVLHKHDDYPDIFIDNIIDPLTFYNDEIRGGLGGNIDNRKDAICRFFDRIFSYAGDSLLEKYLREFKNYNPLVILDSAGGLGYLEFSILNEIMQSHPYLVLLDDINHLKHFRSYRYIMGNPHFQLLDLDEQEGWLFAKHFP